MIKAEIRDYRISKRDNFRVVREKDLSKLKKMGVFLLLGSFFVFGVLFYIWQQVQIVKLRYEIEDLKEIKKELLNVNKNLKLEVSSLKSLARIEKKAKTELGFELPRKGQILLAKEFLEPAQSSDFAEDSSGGSLIAQKLKSE